MRILRLEVEGFGPFRDRQRLDFAAAAESGILLITGRTGAGKSSLLDAISFALYGAVPRYSGQVARVRSDHLPTDRGTVVELEFEMHGERFRIERSPDWERPSKRRTKTGTGLTKQAAEARLWIWNAEIGDWEGIASRPVDVAAELHAVLGLTHEQFLQVVLLAQGGFQRFLRAGDEDRQATLRTLFRTQRFAETERVLAERRKDVERQNGDREAHITGLLDQMEASAERDRAMLDDEAAGLSELAPTLASGGSQPQDAATETAGTSLLEDTSRSVAERREHSARAAQRFSTRVHALRLHAERLNDESEDAERALRAARELAAAQERLEEAESRRNRLEQMRARIDDDRRVLAAAQRAAAVRDADARVQRETERGDAAVARFRGAIARLYQAREDAMRGALQHDAEHAEAATASELRDASARLGTERDEIATALALLREIAKDERGRPEAVNARDAARAAVESARAALSTARTRSEQLPALIARAREVQQSTALAAATVPQREETLQRSKARIEAVSRARALVPEVEVARAASAERAADVAEQAARVSDLLARRLAGMAGELAAQLTAGSPCSVCGATEHPAPAERHDPVDERQVADAEAAQARAQRSLDAARAEEQERHSQLVSALANAQVEQAAAELQERLDEASARAASELQLAEEQLETARAAQAALPAQGYELERLEAERSGVAAQETAARDALTRREGEFDTATERLAALDARLEAERGPFDTVAERVTAWEALHSALGAGMDAAVECNAARLHLEAAQSDLRAMLSKTEFESIDAARSAARDDDQMAELTERIGAHDTAMQQVAGVLAEPGLQGLPAEPAAVEACEQRLITVRRAARSANELAATAHDRLRERTAQLEHLDLQIGAAAESSEALLRLRRLADTVNGKDPNTRRMRLEVFVLAARLEAIVEAANRRLERMVSGRYRLQHDDGPRSRGKQSGLGLSVLDEYTGRTRTTDSLSGGETFLASLALALGLADVVTAESGGVRLDTLFIDEGFGTLDPDALDQALGTLDALREGGRTVALISHVAEMRDRLPAQLEVAVDDRGVSRLQGQGVLTAPNDTRPASAE